MYLLDTNLLLEVLLRRTKTKEVEAFLDRRGQIPLYLTDFSVHSVGIMLFQRKMHDAFMRAIVDLFWVAGVKLVCLNPEDMTNVAEAAHRFSLDFDDAYQYVAAKKNNLTLLSFDSDFDRTERGRKTPREVLKT